MTNYRLRKKKRTFGHVEEEIFDLHETKKRISQIREEILNPHKEYEFVGGKSNLPGDPTSSKVIDLDENKNLRYMQEIVREIEYVYEHSSKQMQRFMDLFYWTKPQTMTIEGVAQKIFVSRSSAYRMRSHVVYQVAVRMGWWSR